MGDYYDQEKQKRGSIRVAKQQATDPLGTLSSLVNLGPDRRFLEKSVATTGTTDTRNIAVIGTRSLFHRRGTNPRQGQKYA